MSTTQGGPGLPGITGDGGERLVPDVRGGAGAGRAPDIAMWFSFFSGTRVLAAPSRNTAANCR